MCLFAGQIAPHCAESEGKASGGELSVGKSGTDSEEGASPAPLLKAKESESVEMMVLSTLMGGYVPGSESASDVDDASPRKNRRARQQIWEKKFGAKAKRYLDDLRRAAMIEYKEATPAK